MEAVIVDAAGASPTICLLIARPRSFESNAAIVAGRQVEKELSVGQSKRCARVRRTD